MLYKIPSYRSSKIFATRVFWRFGRGTWARWGKNGAPYWGSRRCPRRGVQKRASGKEEGRENFSTKFSLNVRSKTGDGRTKFSGEGAKPPPQTPPPVGVGSCGGTGQ